MNKVEPGINEWQYPKAGSVYGPYLEAKEMQVTFQKEFPGRELLQLTDHRPICVPDTSGEDIIVMQQRFEETVSAILSKQIAQGKPSLVLIGHGSGALVLGHILMNIKYISKESHQCTIRAGTCSISKYRKVDGSELIRPGLGVWKQDWNGKTDFLKNGEEVSLLSSIWKGP